MELILSDRVETLLHFSSQDERKKIQAWFEYLRNWEMDEFARSRSVLLNVNGQSMYLFRTITDVRIFYTVDVVNKTITVIDVTSRDTILATGGVPTGG